MQSKFAVTFDIGRWGCEQEAARAELEQSVAVDEEGKAMSVTQLLHASKMCLVQADQKVAPYSPTARLLLALLNHTGMLLVPSPFLLFSSRLLTHSFGLLIFFLSPPSSLGFRPRNVRLQPLPRC